MFICYSCNIISYDVHSYSHKGTGHHFKNLGTKEIDTKNSVGKTFIDYCDKFEIIKLQEKTSVELLEIYELVNMCR